MAVPTVGDDAGYRREEENWNLVDEGNNAKQPGGTSEAINEPVLSDILHPGADQGDELAAEEQLKIAMPQGAESGSDTQAFFGFLAARFAQLRGRGAF